MDLRFTEQDEVFRTELRKWLEAEVPRHGSPPADYTQIALDTGAVRADGSPLVFSISSGGDGLSTAVVDAVSVCVRA